MDASEISSRPSVLEKWGGIALLAFTFLLPIFVVPSGAVPFQSGKAMLTFLVVFILFIVWLVSRLKAGSFRLPWSLSTLLLLAIVVVYFLSAILSASPVQGIVGSGFQLDTALSILSFVLLLLMVPHLLRTKQSIFNLYLALYASFAVIFLFELIRLVAGPSVFTLGVLTSSVSNLVGSWNDLGVFVGLISILSLVMLEIVPPQGILRWILYGALVLSVLSLIVVNFNAVWYVVGAFALALLVYSFAFSRAFRGEADLGMGGRARGKISWTALGTFLVALIFSLTGSQFISGNHPSWNIGNAISEKLGISQLEARPSWGTTALIAQGTLKTSPLLGAGPNQFVTEWLKYRPKIVNESAFWNIDFNFGIGIIPSALTSVGLLGLLAWLAFLAVFAYRGFKALRRPREDLFGYYISVTAFVAALYLWIMAIFYTTSTVPFVLAFILTGTFFAALSVQGAMREKVISFTEEPSIRFVALLATIVCIAGSVVGLFVIGQKNIATAYFNRALVSYAATGDLAKAEINVRRAIAISNEDTYYRGLSEIALINLNRVASQITANTPPDQVRNQFQVLLGGAIQAAQAARDANPSNYQNWLSLARTYESVVPIKIAGAYDNSKQNYLEAEKRNPTSPAIPLMMARLEVENSSNAKAKEFINQSLGLKSNYTDAIYLLSQIQVADGDLKAAIQSVQAASVITPNDPTVFFQLGFLEYNDKAYAKAAEALERAVALEGQYANARYFLGLSYDKLNRANDAINQFAEIQKTNPDNAEVKQILSNLRAGKGAFAEVKPPLDDKPEKRKNPPIPETERPTDSL